MKLLGNLGNLDFTDWGLGLASAVISGGASAVASGFVVAMNDPVHYGLGTAKFIEVVGSVFVISGVLSGMNFLRTKPIPDLKKIVTTVQTTEKQDKPLVVITTVQETKMEPVKPEGETK